MASPALKQSEPVAPQEETEKMGNTISAVSRKWSEPVQLCGACAYVLPDHWEGCFYRVAAEPVAPVPQPEPEPHASDCAFWVNEPCDCITGGKSGATPLNKGYFCNHFKRAENRFALYVIHISYPTPHHLYESHTNVQRAEKSVGVFKMRITVGMSAKMIPSSRNRIQRHLRLG